MFEPFNLAELRAQAEEDARLQIYEPDSVILALLGPEPSFDPAGNLRHANVGARLQNPLIEEGEADLRRQEDEMTKHPSAPLLCVALVVLLFLESAASIFVMRSLGIESPERVIFGTALAMAIFFGLWLTSRVKNRLASIGAITFLGLLIAAVTIVRLDASGADTGSVHLASAVIMVAITVGPALLGEQVLRLLAPALPILRKRNSLSRRVGGAKVSRFMATRFVNRMADRQEAWQRNAARMRALYDIFHRSAEAELRGASPSHLNPQSTQERTFK